jgi:hypothetical protein
LSSKQAYEESEKFLKDAQDCYNNVTILQKEKNQAVNQECKKLQNLALEIDSMQAKANDSIKLADDCATTAALMLELSAEARASAEQENTESAKCTESAKFTEKADLIERRDLLANAAYYIGGVIGGIIAFAAKGFFISVTLSLLPYSIALIALVIAGAGIVAITGCLAVNSFFSNWTSLSDDDIKADLSFSSAS